MTMNEKSVKLYKEMAVLIVDDDKTVLHRLESFIKKYFKEVVLTQDTNEALECFHKQRFDLIMTNYNMPMMNGLELITHIREKDQIIPIVFITSSQEYEVYQDALNLNVTHSLSKPFSQEDIEALLSKILEPIFSYKMVQDLRLNELSQLKNEKKYDTHQQEQAFLKEHQAIRNDFYYSYYQLTSSEDIWYLDGSYRPHDILSGDTYSIRQPDEDKAFFFIIDAMGKGISASVTSIVASSYINHLVDTKDLSFKDFLQDFNDYIIKNLLDEEVLAVLFAQLDFKDQTLCVSSFGMPPILICDEDNQLTKIKTNNLPISKHNHQFNIDCHDISTMKKMLFCSDGLVESTLDNGELYFSHLKQDFIKSKTRSSFLMKLYSKVPYPDDDITLLFFQKLRPSYEKMVSIECDTKLNEVEKVIMDFHTYLEDNFVDPIHTAKLGMIFTEMMMNAYEHGNLGISNKHKHKLISQGELNDECKRRELKYGSRRIKVHYLIHAQGEGQSLKFDIKDEGEGFDTEIFKNMIFDKTGVNGRGFKIAKKMVDAIYYSPKGNHVILHKYIPKDI